MPLPLLYTALSATLLSADPPAPAVELPPPRVVIVEPAYPNYYRRSAYDVWQNYSLARDMTWQPRIDYVPGQGYFYVYNGKPYLYAPIYQRWVSPSVQGTPYRSLPQMPPVIVIEEEVLPAPTVKPEEEPAEKKPAEKKAGEAKPTSTKKAKRPAVKEPERMPPADE